MTDNDSGKRIEASTAKRNDGSPPDLSPIPRRLKRIEPPHGEEDQIEDSQIAKLKGQIVILGDPGAGKSVLMETLGNLPHVTFVRATQLVRMANPERTLGSVRRLVIDGVDEVASNAEGGGVDAVLMKLSVLENPDFILSCRAADWRGAADRIKIKDDYGRDPTLLALNPFDREDATSFLRTRFPSLDAEDVLTHLIQRGLHDIYGNPLTLRLLGEVAHNGGKLPESRGELLARACPKLILEANDRHKDKPHAGADPEELMISAGAGAAAFLLCDKLGIFTGANSDRPSAYFALQTVNSLPHCSTLDDAIQTRLFKGEGENLLVPVHRVVAEYLAAKWLARCVSSGQSARRIIAMVRQSGSVPTSLRAVNAWLAGFSPELGVRCVTDDPYGVLRYGEVDGLPTSTARALLRALAALSKEDPFFRAEDWSRQSTRGLARVELKDDLLALLKAPGEHQALGGLLIDALQGTDLGRTLEAELHAMLMDPARPYPQRSSSLTILEEQGAITSWPELLTDLANLGDSSSLRIAAAAVMNSAADVVPADQAVPILLANIGLTVSQVERHGIRMHHSLRASKLLLRQPDEVLDAWLDTIADYGALVRKQDQRRNTLVDFTLSLLAQRLERATRPTAEQVSGWIGWLRGQRGYDDKASARIRKIFADDVDFRQAVHAAMLLGVSAKELMKMVFRVGDVPLGLYPNEEDCAALLREWRLKEVSAGPDTEVWKTLVWLGRTRDGLSATFREVAEETARGDLARLEIIKEFAQPIAEQRDPEDEKWQAEREAERDAAFASHREYIDANLSDVDAGGALLSNAADAYRGRFYDVSDLPGEPHEQLDAFLTPRLAQRVRDGFIASLSRSDLPTALQIAQSHAQNKHYTIETVLLAGVAEMVRTGLPLSDLPRENLESAFMAWRRDPGSNTEDSRGIEDGLAAIVLDTPEAQERFYRASIEPQLEADAEHIDDLYYLTHLKPTVPLAARLAREWLGKFPMMRARTMGELIPSALASDLADLRQLVTENLARPCADYEALMMCLSLDFMVDFGGREADLREAAADCPDLLWNLRTALHAPMGSRLSLLSPDQLGYIVGAFSPHWPFTSRPGRTTIGDTNDWDATEFIKECIAALSAIPSSAAGAALAALIDGPDHGYTDDLKHAAAQQRRVQADHDYDPADFGTLKAAVTGALPASVDDLRAFFEDRLEALRMKLNGDNLDSWVVYWDRERPHEENYCRNRLVGQMSGELPAAVAFGPEEQMPGITRADIGLRLNQLVLPIEIKGQWHSEVWMAASKQLDAQYTRDWRADGRGVYVVLWFGDTVGKTLPPHPLGRAAPETPEELRSMLIERIPPQRRPFIDVYVLDVSGTAEGRKRLAIGRERKRKRRK